MYFAELWTYLHKGHIAIKHEPPDIQADTINALFLYLQEHPDMLYPSLLSEQAITFLQWYLDEILPTQGYHSEDVCIITTEYHDLLERVQTSVEIATRLEEMFEAILGRLQQYANVSSVTNAVFHIFCNPLNTKSAMLDFRDRELLNLFSQTQEALTLQHASAFFSRLFDLLDKTIATSNLSIPYSISNARPLLDYCLDAYFQGKAIFVDTFFKGCIMPIWVSVDVSQTSEHVEFVNRHIDANMQMSADIARSLACQYLMQTLGGELPENITVQCWFPHPGACYRDTSLSLLIGLNIVGEVLGIGAFPATAVTGEVNQYGQINSVGYLHQKIDAVKAYPGIMRMLAPSGNLKVLPRKEQQSFSLVEISTFTEALEAYYGTRLQKKISTSSSGRRQFLANFGRSGLWTGLLTLFGVKVTPTPSLKLKERDIELCKNNIEYATLLCGMEERDRARKMLQTVIQKIDEHDTSYEALSVKAQACEALGWSYVAERRKDDSIRELQHAYGIWKNLNNKEQQAHQLLLMGAVFGDSGRQEEIRLHNKQALRYLHAANDLLTLPMKTFYASRSHYYSRLGVLYYWLGEYKMAAMYSRKGVELFGEFDTSTNPYYATNTQHLGRVLIQLREFDEAYDLIQSTSQSPLLQSPGSQARNFRTFSDFFLAIGDYDKGLEFAHKTAELSNMHNLTIQKIGIQQVLSRYGLPSSVITLT